jgi:hypothetical protein
MNPGNSHRHLFALVVALFGATLFAGCMESERKTYSYSYRNGKSMKDSTSIRMYTYPDTTYDTVPVLLRYTADSVLFQYEYDYRTDSRIADGGYYESAYFVVPTGAVNFNMSGPEKVFFFNSCFGACGPKVVTDALISGYQTGAGKYHVEGTVIYSDTVRWTEDRDTVFRNAVNFSGTFKPVK